MHGNTHKPWSILYCYRNLPKCQPPLKARWQFGFIDGSNAGARRGEFWGFPTKCGDSTPVLAFWFWYFLGSIQHVIAITQELIHWPYPEKLTLGGFKFSPFLSCRTCGGCLARRGTWNGTGLLRGICERFLQRLNGFGFHLINGRARWVFRWQHVESTSWTARAA